MIGNQTPVPEFLQRLPFLQHWALCVIDCDGIDPSEPSSCDHFLKAKYFDLSVSLQSCYRIICSLVAFVASLFPSFVISLALVAFVNGLWMSVSGFMIPPTILNPFYKYVFSYWDYQKYVFEGMMINEFSDRVYDCGEGCTCMYDSHLADQCKIDGQAVLDQYGYERGHMGRDVGIMISIIFGYRLASWIVLRVRK